MDIIIIILLLVIAAEATYLVAVNTKKSVNKKAGRPIFVDTSVLIDGRIIAVAQSGFVGSDTLFIPRSVIGELQYLADNADNEKRSRARHGLDVVSDLQKMPNVKVEIFQDGSKAEEGVDERLLKLAKQYNGAVCTIDYNLNKVAQVENIPVLNVNDLAMSLRMAYLPGEKMLLEVTQKGQDGHQAVGHLADGTMVVVERANKFIGQTVEIEFIRSLQTAAGKMMFAKLVEKKQMPKQASVPEKAAQAVRKQFDRPAKQSQPQRAKQSSVVPQVASAPMTYHSDRNDQRLASKSTRPVAPRQQPTQRQPKQQAPKRVRSSAQNEADLIAMVNSQADDE
mgnify:CR=1 FL=1